MTRDELFTVVESTGAYCIKRPDGSYFFQLYDHNIQKLAAALTSATPAGEGLTDEREAFKRHIQATEQREPLLWSQVWANSMREDPLPDHFAGKYFINADQKAWDAWEARAALSTPPQPTERSAEFEALLAVKEHAEFDAARRDPSVLRGQLLTILDICNTAIAAAPQKGEAA